MGKKSRKKEDIKKENNMNTEEINEIKDDVVEEVTETTTEVDESQNEDLENTEKDNESVEENTETKEEHETSDLNDNIENNEVIGKISGYDKLYVRKEANVDSEPVGIVTKDDDLSIDVIHSTDDFYKVYTSNGLEGYCVKKFVKVD